MERPFCTSRLSKFCIKDWPEPKSAAFLELSPSEPKAVGTAAFPVQSFSSHFLEDSREALAKWDIDTAVQLILCREKFFVKEMYKYLDYQDMLTLRRRELLYRTWWLNVGEPLTRKNSDKVSSPRSVIKRKQGESASYIKYSNKMVLGSPDHKGVASALAEEGSRNKRSCQGNAFISHYDPEEYDPFCLRNKDPGHLKVILPPFRDPLLQAQRNRAEENRTHLQGKIHRMKESKEAQKAKQLAAPPPFSFARRDRRPNSGPAQAKKLQKGSVRAKSGSAGSCRVPSIRYFPVLKLRLEDVQDKVVDSVLAISGLMLPAWRMAGRDEVGSSSASSKAAEAWSHRPIWLRSMNKPAGHPCSRREQEKPTSHTP